jgi:phosphohistidine phosphatase SixA
MRVVSRPHLPPEKIPRPRAAYIKAIGLLVVVLVVGALVAGFTELPLSPVTLNDPSQSEAVTFKAQWKAGNIVFLIRHAERCDRSSNPCLGPADGITVAGQEEARRVGAALASLGMGSTDVVTSPLTRTVQTAQALFNASGTEQAWVHECGSHFAKDISASKAAGRNLVLVTHSGCISQFEAQAGFPHASVAEYTSTLVATVGVDGKLNIVGVINAQDWAKLNAQ